MSDTKADIIKTSVIICGLLALKFITALILFFPVKNNVNDGGSVVWKPVTGLYEVWEYHRMTDEYNSYIVGSAVYLSGIEIYNNRTVIYE